MSSPGVHSRVQEADGRGHVDDAHCAHSLQVAYSAAPSKFRSCALDTHEALPPSDHRVAPACSYKRTMPARRKAQIDPAAYLQHALGPVESMPVTEVTSGLAERSKALQNSDWALLDTLEAHMCVDARERQAQLKEATCQRTRAYLDRQMQVAVPCTRNALQHAVLSPGDREQHLSCAGGCRGAEQAPARAGA